MKIVLFVFFCLRVYSANLKQGLDLTQPLELMVQLYGQSVNSLTQGVEFQLLLLLYQDQASAVQAQLDSCESDRWASIGPIFKTVSSDLEALANLCQASTPPISSLLQYVLQVMAELAAPCPGLTVDLQGDIENLVAASIIQGVQFANIWIGPLARFSAKAVASIESRRRFPQTNLADAVKESLGVSETAIAQTDNDTATFAGALLNLTNEVANTGIPKLEDVRTALETGVAVLNDYGSEYTQVLEASIEYIKMAVKTLC